MAWPETVPLWELCVVPPAYGDVFTPPRLHELRDVLYDGRPRGWAAVPLDGLTGPGGVVEPLAVTRGPNPHSFTPTAPVVWARGALTRCEASLSTHHGLACPWGGSGDCLPGAALVDEREALTIRSSVRGTDGRSWSLITRLYLDGSVETFFGVVQRRWRAWRPCRILRYTLWPPAK